MGFLKSFFTKDKKERLDQGLSRSKKSFFPNLELQLQVIPRLMIKCSMSWKKYLLDPMLVLLPH